MLLLSLGGVVVVGYFFFAAFLSPNQSGEDLSREVSPDKTQKDSHPETSITSVRPDFDLSPVSAGRVPPAVPQAQLLDEEEAEEEKKNSDRKLSSGTPVKPISAKSGSPEIRLYPKSDQHTALVFSISRFGI